MRVIKISKKKNLYNVILSDNTSLSFYDETILKYNLLKPREIKKEELVEIIKYNDEIKAFNIALKYITVKLRTKKEIKQKLNEYDNLIITKVITKLEKLGYLNDSLYIKSYITDAVNLTLKGPKKISFELEKLGFKNPKINKVLETYDNTIWQDKIYKIIKKKQKSNHNLSKNMFINKLKKDLINLGFTKDLIEQCLTNTNFVENSDILNKVYNKELKKLSQKYDGNALNTKLRYNLYKKGFNLNDIDKLINNYVD